MQLIDAANAARRQTRVSITGRKAGADAESQLDSLYRTSERLAVYGSLAPGRQNHHIVEPLGGEWTAGVIEGDLAQFGWGAAIGYPALRLRPSGPAVPVQVLTSTALPAAWASLDEFEGPEYCRVLAPVWSGAPGSARSLVAVANLYEAATGSRIDIGHGG
jgi:gamma-glutamylcyclotransferase (GGCT)/AIG2-like uncharacterized protein YtfP